MATASETATAGYIIMIHVTCRCNASGTSTRYYELIVGVPVADIAADTGFDICLLSGSGCRRRWQNHVLCLLWLWQDERHDNDSAAEIVDETVVRVAGFMRLVHFMIARVAIEGLDFYSALEPVL